MDDYNKDFFLTSSNIRVCPFSEAASLLTTDQEVSAFGAYRDGLPEYTLDDVSKHASVKERVWVAYRHGVYDITDFIQEHPGKFKLIGCVI